MQIVVADIEGTVDAAGKGDPVFGLNYLQRGAGVRVSVYDHFFYHDQINQICLRKSLSYFKYTYYNGIPVCSPPQTIPPPWLLP